MSILFNPKVQDFYYELEIVLFEKGYFSHKETADEYSVYRKYPYKSASFVRKTLIY